MEQARKTPPPQSDPRIDEIKERMHKMKQGSEFFNKIKEAQDIIFPPLQKLGQEVAMMANPKRLRNARINGVDVTVTQLSDGRIIINTHSEEESDICYNKVTWSTMSPAQKILNKLQFWK